MFLDQLPPLQISGPNAVWDYIFDMLRLYKPLVGPFV